MEQISSEEMDAFMDDSVESSAVAEAESAPQEESTDQVETPDTEETDEGEDQEEQEDQPDSERKPYKKDNVQKRFDKLTRRYYTEKNRAEQLEKKLSQLEMLNKSELPEPKLEDFDYDQEEHNRALIRHYAKVELDNQRREQARAQQDIEQKSLAEQHQIRVKEANIDSYQEKVEHLMSTFPEEEPMPWDMVEAIQRSEVGPQIVDYFAANPDRAHSIADRDPRSIILEIGKLSERLSAPKSKKIPSAPDPMRPIKSGAKVSGKNPSKMSMDDIMDDDSL